MPTWIVHDDRASESLRPLTWLRPASSLLLGAETLLARWRRLVAPDPVRVVCRPHLAPLEEGRTSWEDGARSVAAAGREDGKATGGVGDLWVSDLLVPDARLISELRTLPEGALGTAAGLAVAYRPAGNAKATPADLLGPVAETSETAALPRRELSAPRQVSSLGDLLRWQEELLPADLERILREGPSPDGAGDGHAYRPDRLRVSPGCRIDLGAVLDAREGPIVLGPETRVGPHSWIEGPFFAGAGCTILGGRVGGGTSLGPRTRVHGEVEATVFLGYSNKAHDGFVGHSYIGEWVNLGAMTTTSDLKNNYSAVSLDVGGTRIATGRKKVGAFIGDHVKTGIGCLLSTGTVLGVGANLFGEPAVPGRWVPDFVWGTGGAAMEYELNKFLATAETVVGRRGIAWTPELSAALRVVHEETRPARRNHLSHGAGETE